MQGAGAERGHAAQVDLDQLLWGKVKKVKIFMWLNNTRKTG